MSTTVIVISGILVAFIGLIVYNHKRMKNLPNAPDHKNIKQLNNKNFKHQIRSGVVLVDFWAPWCGPCKVMGPVLNEIAESESDKVTIAKVNVDHHQQLAKKFKIRGIPTMVMFKNGKEVKRVSGVKSRKFLQKEIEALTAS